VTVHASGSSGTWLPQSYPGDSEVTHDYNGQGLHRYRAKWWTAADNEPGDPACTSTSADGNDKVWLDLGKT
jgi:chitinase